MVVCQWPKPCRRCGSNRNACTPSLPGDACPPRAPRYAPYPSGLDERLIEALRQGGLSELYTHQAQAITAALQGDTVAVVTPAASGKTLCYNLPVLQCLLADPQARALYLFPTKALAQDQLAALHDLIAPLRSSAGGSQSAFSCSTYDGDTPPGQRAKIHDGARIILSNPDMLHAGILPQHTRWASFFTHLRVVVVDEMHVYRGVFGSHVANVLRRLRRICRFYGNDPQFILASATIANPAQLAERMVEKPVTVIGPEQNGAPQGERNLIFCNPPMVDPSLGIRRSSGLEAADWAAHFLGHGVQTIVFAGSRLNTELILLEMRNQGAEPGSRARLQDLKSTIRGYRGGYLPHERREIERGLREGSVRAVVATTALELGIDIGQLGVALLAGYPGTIASTWQQMGRAGRRQEAAVGVLIASAEPLDQYMIAHPDYLFERSPERALINPDNPLILADHLACAAAELPFRAGEGFGSAPPIDGILEYLAGAGELYQAGGRYYWGGEGYPAATVSLRTGSADRVVIQATGVDGKPQVIGELERFGVPQLAYEGAIYIHGGETYLVEKLDWEGGIAHVRPVTVDTYTRSMIGEEVKVLAEQEARTERLPLAGQVEASDERELATTNLPAALDPSDGDRQDLASPHVPAELGIVWGDVRVISKATGYRIQRRGSHEVLGFGVIDLPEQVLETTACWLTLSETLIDRLKEAGDWLSDPNEYGANWQAQRAAARARDGYRCQSCGVPEREGKQHDVHHKIPFRAFVADASLRPGLPAGEAWRAANRAGQPGYPVFLLPSSGREQRTHAFRPGRSGGLIGRRRTALLDVRPARSGAGRGAAGGRDQAADHHPLREDPGRHRLCGRVVPAHAHTVAGRVLTRCSPAPASAAARPASARYSIMITRWTPKRSPGPCCRAICAPVLPSAPEEVSGGKSPGDLLAM